MSGFPYLTLSSLDTDDIYTVLVYLLDAVIAQAYRVLLINFLKFIVLILGGSFNDQFVSGSYYNFLSSEADVSESG